MRDFLLKVEAVNIYRYVGRTNDLSTVRGSGLTLLYATQKGTLEALLMQGEDPVNVQFEEIQAGASTGIFRFPAVDMTAAEDVGDKVRQALCRDLPEGVVDGVKPQYATFVVSVEPDSDKAEAYSRAMRRLTAKGRIEQLQTPTLRFPAWNEGTEAGVCVLDGVSPTFQKLCEGSLEDVRSLNKAEIGMAPGTLAAREFGRNLRQKRFYLDELGVNADDEDSPLRHPFSKSFEEICFFPPQGLSRLEGKIAVIYIDGNRFGEAKAKLSEKKGAERDYEFAEAIKESRRALLRELIALMNQEQQPMDWVGVVKDERRNQWTANECYRLETLLWGGDELIWVVPAWQGLAVLRLFYQHFARHQSSESWPFHRSKASISHAAGVVFGNHKSPIARIKSMAYDLCELAKGTSRDKDLIAYEVMESFDYPTEAMETYRARGIPRGVADPWMPLTVEGLGVLLDEFAAVEGGLAKRQLYALIRRLHAATDEQENRRRAETACRELPETPAARRAISRLRKEGGMDPVAMWQHLANLWDYVVPDTDREEGGAHGGS